MPLRLLFAVCLVASLALSTDAAAQPDRFLRGTVHDAATGLPLGDVTLQVASPFGTRGTLSSATGQFRLTIPRGRVLAIAMRIGFSPDTLLVAPDDSIIEFRLSPAPLTLSPQLIRAERTFSTSSRSIRELDVRLRPRESSQELLRLVPGLVIAQHAGGGKAEQIFLRGFDADHGTDVAISVDGTPVNMVTHAHGQGYADLHFLMPEVVERVDVRKGPFDARDGDFSTAGAVAFTTKDRIDQPLLAVRGGSFGTGHLLAMLPLGQRDAEAGGYVAGSVHRADGPFDAPQDYERVNGFAKWVVPVTGGAELVATASAFASEWDASGQVPDRAVRSGLIARFGAIDPTEGGSTERYDASVALRSRTGDDAQWETRAYLTRYRFRLFSNFTFFLGDSVNGDGIEQVDDRVSGGLTSHYARTFVGGMLSAWRVGAGVRRDDGDIALTRQRQRTPFASLVAARIGQSHLYAWTSADAQLTEALRLSIGLRGDAFRFAVTDRLVSDDSQGDARWLSIVSPKASIAYDLTDRTILFASAGTGFHSNDARDVVGASPAARVLPRALGTELGLRRVWSGGTVALSLWHLDLESELVYVGDEGVTEPNGRTRRLGVDIEARGRLRTWLWGDADVNLARARLRDEPSGADRIPLAPSVTWTAGLTVRDIDSGFFRPLEGGVRVRHIAARPATEDNSVRALGSTLAEAFASWSFDRVRIHGSIDNLFDVRWNEAQFATTSRLSGEADPVTELHYTPGAPRSLQLGMEYRF